MGEWPEGLYEAARLSNYVYRNRFRIDDYVASAALYARLRPELMLFGHTPPIRVDAAFVNTIAREPGELLTDNSGLAVAAGKPITYEFQIFQLLQFHSLK